MKITSYTRLFISLQILGEIMQSPFPRASSLAFGFYALASLCAVNCRADIVYTTATSSGTASSGNVLSPSDANSYQIGTLQAGTSNLTLNFDKAGSNTKYAIIQFTASNSSSLWQLTGINASFFFDGSHKNDPATTLSNATATWHLYEGLASVGTFTQSWNNMTHPTGANPGPNVYQNTNISAQYNLTGGLQYSLVLESLTTIDVDNDSNSNSVHWIFRNQTPAGGQTFTSVNSGFFSGTYSNTIGTSQNLAFDITATAVPEPGTLILGTLAALGGAGSLWCSKKWLNSAQRVDSSLPGQASADH